jgi:integrase
MQSGETQVRRIEADFKDWLDKPMTGLNTWLIEGWRSDRRKAKANPRTINRNLQRLRACVAKAKAWGILEVHPFEGIKPLKTDNTGRVRYLSAAEEADLRKALITRETRMREERDRFNEWLRERRRELLPRHPEGYVDRLRPLVLTALNTGTRRGELFNLKWQDVNLGAKLLTVRGEEKIEEKGGAKSSQTRRVPLNVEALEVLTAWKGQSAKHAPGDRVFPGAGGERLGSIGHAWTGVATLGGLDDFRFHDLRHHASRLVQGGTDLNIVRELLGHADLSQVLRYAHLDPTNLATAVERVAR